MHFPSLHSYVMPSCMAGGLAPLDMNSTCLIWLYFVPVSAACTLACSMLPRPCLFSTALTAQTACRYVAMGMVATIGGPRAKPTTHAVRCVRCPPHTCTGAALHTSMPVSQLHRPVVCAALGAAKCLCQLKLGVGAEGINSSGIQGVRSGAHLCEGCWAGHTAGPCLLSLSNGVLAVW